MRGSAPTTSPNTRAITWLPPSGRQPEHDRLSSRSAKGRHGNQSRNSGGHHHPLQPQSRRAGAIRPQREHGTGVYAITFSNSSGLYLQGKFEI